jgi:hypothetical protein
MFKTKVVEKIKTHLLCSITLFPKIVLFMPYHIVEPDRPLDHMLMRFSCRITKATDARSECVILIDLHGNSGYAKES